MSQEFIFETTPSPFTIRVVVFDVDDDDGCRTIIDIIETAMISSAGRHIDSIIIDEGAEFNPAQISNIDMRRAKLRSTRIQRVLDHIIAGGELLPPWGRKKT